MTRGQELIEQLDRWLEIRENNGMPTEGLIIAITVSEYDDTPQAFIDYAESKGLIVKRGLWYVN
jgi:hypothetical protein